MQAAKDGFPQREIADAGLLQQDIDAGRRIVVGLNSLTEDDHEETPILRIHPSPSAGMCVGSRR